MTRAQILAFNEFNAAIERARQAYYDEPNACADWCPKCVRPAASNPNCARCRGLRRQRAMRAKRRT